jgi:hypothetical protein
MIINPAGKQGRAEKTIKIKAMNQELLDKIYNETLIKPSLFHHVCYGGGTVKMVDKYTNKETYTCSYQGDKSWITPLCEKCTGLVAEVKSLTSHQEDYNSGMKELYTAISKELASNL